MKITPKVVGKGITARTVTTYSDLTIDEGAQLVIDEFPRRAADSRHPFLDYLDALEARAREELRRHGLPDELVGYCKDGDDGWVRADDERPRRGVRYSSLEVVIREAGHAHDTGPGYAERMLRLIADLKGSDADPAMLSRAFQLGDLARECRLKFVLKSRSRPGGKSRAKSYADRNVWMAREFNRLSSRRSNKKKLAAKISADWAKKNNDHPLGESAAFAAVKAGNKILGGVHRTPTK